MTSTKAALPKPKKAKPVEVPENSVPLRLVCGAMALLCLGTACFYTRTHPLVTFMYVWLAFAGSYVSFFMRQKRNFVLAVFTIIALLLVLGYFCQEMYDQFINNSKVDIFVPFIHALGGLLALQTFELRTRDDLEMNCFIGLGLLCCSMVLAHDASISGILFGYLWLVAAFLYLASSSRVMQLGRYTPTEPTSPSRTEEQPRATGSAVVPISLLPVLGLVFFFTLPRINSVFDFVANQVQMFTQSTSSSRDLVNRNGVAGGGKNGMNGAQVSTVKGAGSAHSPTGKHVKVTNDLTKADQILPEAANDPKGKNESKKPAKKGDKPNPFRPSNVPDKSIAKEDTPPENELLMRDKTAANYDDLLLMEVAAPGDYFYRRQVLTQYDGRKWTAPKPADIQKCTKEQGNRYVELAGVPSLFIPASYPSTAITQRITVRANIGHLIPAAPIPQKIESVYNNILVDENGVLRTEKPILADTVYEIVSAVPTYNLDEMRKIPDDYQAQQKAAKYYADCLQIPKTLPKDVTELAKKVAGPDGNWFQKSERICKYLRTNYQYTAEGEDFPPNRDLVANFLFRPKKIGACGPFASSMAIMARSIGIPARVIGGFAPGDLNGLNGLREIHGRHAHAWAEIYIPNAGWVPFDATPGGTLPAPLEVDNSMLANLARNLAQLQGSINAPRATETPKEQQAESKGTTGFASGKDGKGDGKDAETGAQGSSTANKPQTPPKMPNWADMPRSALGWVLRGLIVLGLIPLTLLVAQAIRQTYLQLKAKSAANAPKQSTVLYLRVVDDLRKYKVDRLPSDTAGDLSERFITALESGTKCHPELPGTLKEFMQLYADDRFGSDDGSEHRTKQLEVLSEKIHTLARRRVYDK